MKFAIVTNDWKRVLPSSCWPARRSQVGKLLFDQNPFGQVGPSGGFARVGVRFLQASADPGPARSSSTRNLFLSGSRPRLLKGRGPKTKRSAPRSKPRSASRWESNSTCNRNAATSS